MPVEHIDIVLVDTQNSGNIGSTARVMKNMGFQNLVLVRPKKHSHLEAVRFSSGAEDILESAKIVDTVSEGSASATVLVGTTRRKRGLKKEVLTVREFKKRIDAEKAYKRWAILFGSEKYGLKNDELRACQFFVAIPTVEDFQSLNLAQAVGVVCYELGNHLPPQKGFSRISAPFSEKDRLYRNLENLLKEVGFLETPNPDRSFASVRDIIERAEIDTKDFNILMGIVKSIEGRLKKI